MKIESEYICLNGNLLMMGICNLFFSEGAKENFPQAFSLHFHVAVLILRNLSSQHPVVPFSPRNKKYIKSPLSQMKALFLSHIHSTCYETMKMKMKFSSSFLSSTSFFPTKIEAFHSILRSKFNGNIRWILMISYALIVQRSFHVSN